MAPFWNNQTARQLGAIFSEAFDQTPTPARQRISGEINPTPIEQMWWRSQGVDLIRQALPGWAGGYRKTRKGVHPADALRQVRTQDPSLRHASMQLGDYPVLDGQQLAYGGGQEAMRRTAQIAGALTGDVAKQGALNIWWFLNAVEAASMVGAQEGLHGVLGERPGMFGTRFRSRKMVPGADVANRLGSPLHGGSMVAASLPMALAAGIAGGTVFRQDGYKAVLPSEGDSTVSENPVLETLYRAVGRKGSLMGWKEFQEERPDVSRDDYESYKAYLHGNPHLIKATMDGIHGPEVNFVGKSLPLLTGVLPIVGGIIGARRGLRMAGNRLGRQGRLQGVADARTTLDRAREELRWNQRLYDDAMKGIPTGDFMPPSEAQLRALRGTVARATQNWSSTNRQVDHTLLGGAILGGSAGLITTGAGAALLEQIRRNAKVAAREKDDEQQLPPA